ncbi:hypothetical protein TorRG33x02_317970 [Trema orientale]|uniref:Uncharacterized protein n=1 Tax=Trema orientale TaxID=63057 RepID=A0A2P5BKQ6_TREOI|nr:hypothetical protein TorRG33x02_317970 [Trema orientale]
MTFEVVGCSPWAVEDRPVFHSHAVFCS